MSEVVQQGYVITKEIEVRPGEFYREYAGPSTAEKPEHDNERAGNTAWEVDTDKVYVYVPGDPGYWHEVGGDD